MNPAGGANLLRTSVASSSNPIRSLIGKYYFQVYITSRYIRQIKYRIHEISSKHIQLSRENQYAWFWSVSFQKEREKKLKHVVKKS